MCLIPGSLQMGDNMVEIARLLALLYGLPHLDYVADNSEGHFGIVRVMSLYQRIVGKVCNCGVFGAEGGYS